MKQSLRFFSLGLLVSALLLLGYSLFFEDSAKKAELSVDDMIESLGDEGYRVVSEDEFITYTLEKDQAQNSSEEEDSSTKSDKKDSEKKANKKDKEKDKDNGNADKNKNDKKDNNKKSKDKDDKDDVVKATVKTKSSIVSQEIADDLVDKKIIKKKERDKFANYLEDNDYSGYI